MTARDGCGSGGGAFLILGAALILIGTCLLAGVLRWRLLLDGAWLATSWLLVTGGVVVVMGGQMLAAGRRPRWMMRAFIGLVAIFVVAGAIVTLQSGGRMPRLHL